MIEAAPESVVDVVVVAVAPWGNMKLVPVDVAVDAPVKLPVQLAPLGQHAMLSAASREQFVPCLQQAFELPRLVQGLYPVGQLLSARLRIWRTSKARLFDWTVCGAENGAVSIESTAGRNEAQTPIHHEARILVAWEAGCDVDWNATEYFSL